MNKAMAAVLATVLTAVAPVAQAALLTYSIVGAPNGQRISDLGRDAEDAWPLDAGMPITFTLTIDDGAVAARVQPFGTSYHAAVSDLAIGALAVDARAGCATRRAACTITLLDAENADSVTLQGPIGALAELAARRGTPQFVQLRARFVDPTGTLLDGEAYHFALHELPAAQFRGQLALLSAGGYAGSPLGFELTSIVPVLDEPARAVASPGAAVLVALALASAAAVCVRRQRTRVVARPTTGAMAADRAGRRAQRTGIGVARSTATAVTLFCGEPSMTRSEYVR